MLALPKAQLRVGQCSLEVFQTIVINHPQISNVRLISHEVSINWRQVYEDEKMNHLGESFRHFVPLQNRWWYRDDFLNLTFDRLEDVGKHRVWSVNSMVRCFGTEGFASPYYRHIPMMNFHFEENAAEQDMYAAIEYICHGKDGAVLKSGRYYHYYGDYLLDNKEWYEFLGEFLMPCILVSPRYVGHALHDGYCSLRLTADNVFKPEIPRVVKVLKN